MLIFISGGVRSGKSSFGERLLEQLSSGDKIYLATSKHYDDEMNMRIAKHQQDRAEKGYRTIEKSDNIDRVVKELKKGDSVLLDCLGTLVANEMFSDYSVSYNEVMKEEIVNRIFSGVQLIQAAVSHLVVISNDVFSDGIVYDNATEQYMEVLGRLHVLIAAAADIAVECVFGSATAHKGESLFQSIINKRNENAI